MRKLDLVIPCFNEQESLPLFFEAVKDVKDKMNDVSVRFIFANDGSHFSGICSLSPLALTINNVRNRRILIM